MVFFSVLPGRLGQGSFRSSDAYFCWSLVILQRYDSLTGVSRRCGSTVFLICDNANRTMVPICSLLTLGACEKDDVYRKMIGNFGPDSPVLESETKTICMTFLNALFITLLAFNIGFCSTTCSVTNGPLPQSNARLPRSYPNAKLQANQLNDAMLAGDYEKAADLTYQKLIQLIGGRAKYVNAL